MEGLQSRTIKTLPSEIPRGLYDQLWTPILLNAAPTHADGTDERRLDSVTSLSGQSATASVQSSAYDLSLTATPRLSPVRKLEEPAPSFSEPCPSVSSVETRKISKLWKRVAKHCKFEKVLKVSPTKARKTKRESVLCSDVSIKGTIYTQSSGSSFEALERDSFLEPTRGQRVSMDITRLPLIYPSDAGYYATPEPELMEIRHSVGGDVHRLDKVMSYSSDIYEEPDNSNWGNAMSVELTFPLEESMEHEVEIGEREVKSDAGANTELLAMLKDMKEEYTFLSLQMQIMQKTIQKLDQNGRPIASTLSSWFLRLRKDDPDLSCTENVHFASNIEAGLGGRVRDSIQTVSGTSRRTQSLKNSKELAGPRDMLSIRSGSSMSSLSSRGQAYGYDRRRRHHREEESERVQGPRVRRRHSKSSSIYSLSSLESQSEPETASIPRAPDYRRLPEVPTGNTNPTLPLRSILKAQTERRQTRQIKIVDHNDRPSSGKSSPTPSPKRRKRATRRSGITEETLQAWNARFIPVDGILEGRESILAAKQLRKLPRTPRKLPASPALPKHVQSRNLPPLPMASTSKFPGALTDDAYSASSSYIDTDIEINTSRCTSFLDTTLSNMDADTAPSSAASTPRSSSDVSSIFSRHRHSARTTLLTEIDEYNDTVVRDLREAAPELVLQVKRCLLKELRTKSDGTYDGVYDALEIPLESPAQELEKELQEVLSQLRAKEEELKRLEDTHSDVLRQQARELTKLEQEKEELQWTIADQEEQIYNLIGPTAVADLSVELPEYTPGW